MAQESVSFDGVAVDEVYQKIIKAGVSPYDAKVIAAGWILENLGKSRRVFNYAESFPATDPACQPPPFVRAFVHADWVDGEDVVQAGVTPGEDGFNQRFHKIEGDLDALGGRVATLVACLAAMRTSLRKLLDELRTEINRINSDVFECCQKPSGPSVLQPYFPGLVDMGIYAGSTKFHGKSVSTWQTRQGVLILPEIESMGVEVVAGGRSQSAGRLARFIEEKVDVRQRFPADVSLPNFVQMFGNEKLADGRTVFDVARILPPESKFANLGAMVDELAEREAATLRTLEGADAAIAVALGVDVTRETIADALIDKLASVPPEARSALIRRGISTVGKLATILALDLGRIMREAGVKASAGDAAAWIADAKTLTRLGGGK